MVLPFSLTPTLTLFFLMPALFTDGPHEGFRQDLEDPEIEEPVAVGGQNHQRAVCASFTAARSTYGDRLFKGNGVAVGSHDGAFNRHLDSDPEKTSKGFGEKLAVRDTGESLADRPV